ncbi:MAG: ATP-binding protein [Desulfobacterales bacterium]|nr:ATP-binding protein [Desulfobacterales bacterium]
MRIRAIHAESIPPVQVFSVSELSDTIVIAGPNGVGKTRLIESLLKYFRAPQKVTNIKLELEATCKEEADAWGKKTLETQNPEDTQKFTVTLQRNRQRRKWRSSIILFESDRTIQKIQPFHFTFDLADPYEESIGWDVTFGYMRNRFQDTLHSIFRKIEHQKQSIASRAIELKKQGKEIMHLKFEDPMEPFKEAFSRLLPDKSLLDPSPKKQTLEYEFEGGTFDVKALSSGEREVVNIVFDFLLRSPEHCIVFFDEPDLHLHPELIHSLIDTLGSIGKNNQFILCTHSAHIITASLDNSVIFLSPNKGDNENQAMVIDENDETNRALKLLGHSIGIISLGRRIVFIEGQNASLDKQTYGTIVKNRFPSLVLVPGGGRDTIVSFSTIMENILSKTLWGVDFFMLCDRDAIPFHEPGKDIEALSRGRLRLLSKYHLENYFLDEAIWASIFSSMEPEESWLVSSDDIYEFFKATAREFLSYVTALSVAGSLRKIVGNLDIMPKNCHSKSLDELLPIILQKRQEEQQRVEDILRSEEVSELTKQTYDRLNQSIEDDTALWKNEIPGKPILHAFASKAKIPIGRAKENGVKP